MLTITSFALYTISLLLINGVVLTSMVTKRYRESASVIDAFIYLSVNIMCIGFLHHYRPERKSDKYVPEYLEYGSSAREAMHGRQYGYDTIVDQKQQ